MTQRLPVNDFEWVKQEDLSQFNEAVMKMVIQDFFF